MNGKYYTKDGRECGIVEDFRPKEWFGKVTLFGLEDCSEYGTLEPEALVVTDDGIRHRGCYHKTTNMPTSMIETLDMTNQRSIQFLFFLLKFLEYVFMMNRITKFNTKLDRMEYEELKKANISGMTENELDEYYDRLDELRRSIDEEQDS